MIEAAGFGWLYTIAALAICLASMATSDYLLDYDMPITASAISLGFWLAGSVFVISYLKAKLNKPNIFTGNLYYHNPRIFIFIAIYTYITFFFI
jgi:hypothetical protein